MYVPPQESVKPKLTSRLFFQDHDVAYGKKLFGTVQWEYATFLLDLWEIRIFSDCVMVEQKVQIYAQCIVHEFSFHF